MKIATVHIDGEGRVTFPQPNEAPPEDEWWDSVLTDSRASLRKLHDKQIGYFATMLIEIHCGNCHQHQLLAVDDLVKIYGRERNIDAAISEYVSCTRSHKSCELDFKIRQWEDVQKIRFGWFR